MCRGVLLDRYAWRTSGVQQAHPECKLTQESMCVDALQQCKADSFAHTDKRLSIRAKRVHEVTLSCV